MYIYTVMTGPATMLHEIDNGSMIFCATLLMAIIIMTVYTFDISCILFAPCMGA